MKNLKTKRSPMRPKTSRRRLVIFRCRALPGSDVNLAGSFNAWQHDRNRMRPLPEDGEYRATLVLPPGRYEYKFVVNGEWLADPGATEWAINPHGSLNSVVVVP